MLFQKLDIMNLLLWPMKNQCALKLCTTASVEDVLLSIDPEDTGITLNIASNLATTVPSLQVTHFLDTNRHHTRTRLPLRRSLIS